MSDEQEQAADDKEWAAQEREQTTDEQEQAASTAAASAASTAAASQHSRGAASQRSQQRNSQPAKRAAWLKYRCALFRQKCEHAIEQVNQHRSSTREHISKIDLTQ